MRYNPSTDKAVDIDAIANQCRAAIAPAPVVIQALRMGEYAQNAFRSRAEFGAGHVHASTREGAERLAGWHAADVSKALGLYRQGRVFERLMTQR